MMAQRGGSRRSGQAERQRQQQALRREEAAQQKAADQAARAAERKAREDDRLRKQAHVDAQVATAERETAAVEEKIKYLDSVLVRALGTPPASFDSFRRAYADTPFSPGLLGSAAPNPSKESFLPPEPRGLGRLFHGRYERQHQIGLQLYNETLSAHGDQERERLKELKAARTAHAEKAARARRQIDEHNAKITQIHQSFNEGQAESVEWFVTQVLNSSSYPQEFPHRHQAAYRPENRDVVVEIELPNQNIIPQVRGYKYVKTRDAIDPVPRPEKEIKQRYADLIGQVALRTLHEIFAATTSAIVDAVVFNGRVTTTDRATGHEVRPHLLSVTTERARFTELTLDRVDPAACLKRLNALVSPNPFDLEAVEPFIEFDLSRFRFMDNLEVAATLDSRRNLLKLSPTEFEHLIRELFVAMGAEAWNTIPSKDGGVDAVATSKNLFFGGVCLIQAKRYTGVVGLEAVHALTGVMTDHNATTGVLVTTSWFGRASEEFARRNRITLINGAELKHLIMQNLHLDVLPGTSPPRRRQQQDRSSS